MRAEPHPALPETEQQARIAWAERTFGLAFWSETGTEKEALIVGLIDLLTPQKYFIVPDTGWSGWDLKIARGLTSRAQILVCAENHGGAKRLLRVRCAMRLSRFAVFVLRAYAVLTAFALVMGWPVAAAVLAAAALVNLGVMAVKLGMFGRLMHRIIEAVAKPIGLIPVAPKIAAHPAAVPQRA